MLYSFLDQEYNTSIKLNDKQLDGEEVFVFYEYNQAFVSHIPNFFYQLISKFNKEIPAISAGEININTKSGID